MRIYELIALSIIGINAILFLLMGLDKWLAIHHKERISERTLLTLALFFASIGLILGMWLFRHKIRKLKFQILAPLFLILQGLILVYAIKIL